MLLLRAALIIVTLGFTRAASSSECCSILKSNITAAPNSKAYNATIYGFWSGQARDDKSTCVLQPTTREHVAAVVRTLTRWRCQFSVKGGGHTPFAGAALINDGVTIDLAKLNTISVDKNAGIAHVGAGLKWGQIYEYLETKGMMVSSGRASLVGIGGLVIGGGYSWFAPQKGFVADTVINFELVVGNGSIINVNATSNLDLFVGLKGGGNNFGIVTCYDLESFPFEKLWGGIMTYPTSTAKAQIKFFTNFTNHLSDDPKANFLNIWSYRQVSGSQSSLNVIDYVAPVEAPAIYSDALAIPNLISSTMRITNVSSLTDELAGGTSTLNSRHIFVTTTFSNNAEMYETAVNISNKHLEPFKNTTGLVWSILFQPIPLIVSERSIATDGNIMGVDRNKENLTLFLVYVTWLKASDDQKFTDAAYATVDEINAVAGTLGVTNPFIYLNYAGQKQNSLAGYGEENMEKMRTLSRKYDPQGTFQKLIKGGFKIPGMEIVVD
ncbi:uncharacterized protein EAF02_001621 [Botrytis sinoallii]|uniref:uncharacterized protein n=1 Tax=Botrytis sinoallii TaxID=1463999 RepID=UPI0018FF4EC3|nr:uncharacterized protein EAF02_001621 [Botrytis sinoallii]KAF7891296.1 hypothetical protein EAF02_001621 [Botrytis sinoallii]